MANLTITVDDEVLKQARIRALEENSSVNAYWGAICRTTREPTRRDSAAKKHSTPSLPWRSSALRPRRTNLDARGSA
jgi:hypothetical protein